MRRIEMLTRFSAMTAAVLSGVTASLSFAAPSQAAQEKPVVVYAEPQENVRTERVSYADLNLVERRDQRRLRARVSVAVKRVCLFEDGRTGLQVPAYTRCSTDAWDDANPQIAQAVTRAQQIALTGHSSIPAAAIRISARG
jgi:UrcA family protein